MSQCLNMPSAPASSARRSIWAGDIAFLSSAFLLLKNFPQPLRAKPTANSNTEAIEKPMRKLKSSSVSAPEKADSKTATPVNRSAEPCAPSVDLQTSAAIAQQTQAQPVIADLETSAATAQQSATPPVRNVSLETFVREGWSLLEPVSTLCWTWHLSLICDYLTMVRDGQEAKPGT